MQASPQKTRLASGFTLVELMISIAIVLLLIAGINLIFSTTSKAVGAGQALSEGARNNQAAQAVMYRDFSAAVTDDGAPYMIIYNHATPAFRTLGDQQADRDFDPAVNDKSKILTLDNDNDNQEGVSAGETIDPSTYNERNHRIDMISFFARDLFKRQTGNPGTYVANESTQEALVWYGHVYIPNNNGLYSASSLPGAGTFGSNNNPNNFYATQWILGRQAILLNSDPGNPPTDSAGIPQNYFQTAVAATDLTPLAVSPSTPAKIVVAPDDTSGFAAIQYSRYDVSDTSMQLFKQRLNAWLDPVTGNPADFWWQRLFAGLNVNRFACNPYVTKPITSAEFARTSPIFMPACSQFIVEFAGDYMQQDGATGLRTDVTPDSILDFVVVNGAHKVRWYGMPRNVDPFNETPATGPRIRANEGDVAPVYASLGAVQTWEHPVLLPTGAVTDFYANTPINSEYTCAWGPSDASARPWMIRITYTLDDPSTRLSTPLTYEYVFKLK